MESLAIDYVANYQSLILASKLSDTIRRESSVP